MLHPNWEHRGRERNEIEEQIGGIRRSESAISSIALAEADRRGRASPFQASTFENKIELLPRMDLSVDRGEQRWMERASFTYLCIMYDRTCDRKKPSKDPALGSFLRKKPSCSEGVSLNYGDEGRTPFRVGWNARLRNSWKRLMENFSGIVQ